MLRIFGIQLKVQCRYSHDGYIQFNHSLSCKMQWNWSKFFVSCNTRFYILYYQTGFKSSLFDPWIQKCRRVHQEKSCHWQIHSCYPWRGWWCKALFTITIMWVNHLCLIFEFRNVEEFVQKNLALTNSQSLFMERMMVQSFLRFICQFAKWIKQSFAPSLHHSLSLKEILQLLKSR